jgi:hypothetical protein
VLRAIEALREMPPYARDREINRGRYSHFSAEEKALLKSLEQPVRPARQPIAPPEPVLQ